MQERGRRSRSIERLVLRYAALAVLLWSLILGVSLWSNLDRQRTITLDLAIHTARAAFDKDQAYRQWASSHGGVYVEPTDRTPPSPWMAHLPDRDLVANDGRKLTLMNPAYMLREMMEDFGALYGIRGRIVGIVYLNPNNKADDWEADAIRRFSASQTQEVQEVVDLDQAPFLRLIRPMRMQQSCQKCHGHLGFANGSVRGAVSISVPLAPYQQAENQAMRTIGLSHGAVWVLGLVGIGAVGRRSTQRLLEKARADEETRLSAFVFSNALEGMLVTDSRGTILRVNPAFETLTGYNAAQVVGQKPSVIKSNHHDTEFYQILWTSLLTDGSWQGEIINRRRDGSIFVAWESIVTVHDDAGGISYFVASISDITEQVETRKRIQHLAHYDHLTDLPNRILFRDRLNHALTVAAREGRPVSLLFLDLDGFKKVNDTKGHRVGDQLLEVIAKRLKSCTRECDTVARLGGDEFAVILENAGPDSAQAVAGKIHAAVMDPVHLGDQNVVVGASIGISQYPEDGGSADVLLKHADIAMYQSKADGKGRSTFYSVDMTEREERRMELEAALRGAIQNGGFEAFYQPKQSLSSGRIVGFEALVRWHHPGLGLVSPADFIPLAEELRLITAIDMIVLEQACITGRAWAEAGYPVSMAVNLSSLDLQNTDLPGMVAKILQRTGFPSRMLELEITESFVMEMGPRQQDIMTELGRLGVGMAVDDFGTGYSSLSYLKRLPVDTLKIDRAFIRDIAVDGRDLTLASTIINLAHSLGLSVVAEGVEDMAQMDLLARHDCDIVQGYYIAKPLNAAAALDLLARMKAIPEQQTL